MIKLNNVRLSFPHLIEPRVTVNESTGKESSSYGCQILVEPDNADFKKLMDNVHSIALETWKDKTGTILQMINEDKLKRFFGKGETKIKKETLEPYEGYAGMMYISCNRKKRPQVYKTNGTVVDSLNDALYLEETRKMYPGCRVNVVLRPWVQDNKFGRALRCELLAVQFNKHDSAFGDGEKDTSSLFSASDSEEVVDFSSDVSLPSFMLG